MLLAGALHAEVTEGRNHGVINTYLGKAYQLALNSKEAQKLVTAGIVPTLILLLKTRAVDGVDLLPILKVLGELSYVHRSSLI